MIRFYLDFFNKLSLYHCSLKSFTSFHSIFLSIFQLYKLIKVLILISYNFYITLNKVKNIVMVNIMCPTLFIENILTLSNANAKALYTLY